MRYINLLLTLTLTLTLLLSAGARNTAPAAIGRHSAADTGVQQQTRRLSLLPSVDGTARRTERHPTVT